MICQSTTTATAARLCKLYGTEARKGDSVPDRLHRRAKILDEPERLQAVPIEALEALASEASGGASRTKAELPQSMFSSCCSCLTFPVSTRAASCRLTESSQHIIGNRQPALGSKAARGRVIKREAVLRTSQGCNFAEVATISDGAEVRESRLVVVLQGVHASGIVGVKIGGIGGYVNSAEGRPEFQQCHVSVATIGFALVIDKQLMY